MRQDAMQGAKHSDAHRHRAHLQRRSAPASCGQHRSDFSDSVDWAQTSMPPPSDDSRHVDLDESRLTHLVGYASTRASITMRRVFVRYLGPLARMIERGWVEPAT